MRHLSIFLLLCAACGDDRDSDGFASDVDCDDTDAAVNPGAVEVCDGVDNDCNNQVDEAGAEGTTPYYADKDADGWGDTTFVVKTCAQPAGFVPDPGDCDDDDPDVNPDDGGC